jgi:hypothetical protein
MIVAYYLTAHDNDSFFLEDEKHPDAPICEKCGFLIDPVNYYNPYFRMKKKTLDLSYTHDLRPIASLKLKEFCKREGYRNLVFKDFEREPNFFQFIIKEIVELDIDKSQPKYENRCTVCGNWEGTYMQNIVIKYLSKELEDGFYRTDVLFSHGNRKNPLFIVGAGTFEKLKREKMKGLIFEPINIPD